MPIFVRDYFLTPSPTRLPYANLTSAQKRILKEIRTSKVRVLPFGLRPKVHKSHIQHHLQNVVLQLVFGYS